MISVIGLLILQRLYLAQRILGKLQTLRTCQVLCKKDCSQGAASQKCNLPSGNFQSLSSPQHVLAPAFGPPAHPSHNAITLGPHCSLQRLRGPNLTFGKLPLGNSTIGKLPLGKSPWKNAFGKVPNTILDLRMAKLCLTFIRSYLVYLRLALLYCGY